ncbi:unnamed protein product [Adineta steineri]|uniref:N-acetyltransferase domain-containing protein n=1 Tax=Adineta steineri TaxID=433720 RepID=A0A815KKQ3_9BILA|nr:unnamed protein product [Adineta steineri]CAF3721298.1 unnamed protein product [Adineta steineri]
MSSELHTNDDDQALAITSNKPNQYEIRPMNETDLPTVLEIEKIVWHDESWDLEFFYNFFNDPLSSCWILENTNSAQSIVGYGLQSLLHNKSSITNLTLHPSQWGRGLGGLLLRHMIKHARLSCAVRMSLEVSTSNKRAYNLYFNHGFRISKLLPQYYSEGSDAYCMILVLSMKFNVD